MPDKENLPEELDTPALQVSGLTKSYGGRAVLDHLELKLPPASLVGLLGPNGAGKTTLLKVVGGLITPDKGKVEIAGYNLYTQEALARAKLAYVPDTPNFYVELSALEQIELMARAHKALEGYPEKAERLLRRFGLWEARNAPPFTFSRGMTQKLALCCAFIRPSSLMLLDEPAGTLDIRSVRRLYELLAEYREQGGTAILSSHQWESLQNLCDMFVLMDQGQVLAAGDLPFLREVANLPEDASLRDVYLAYMYDEEDYEDESEADETGEEEEQEE